MREALPQVERQLDNEEVEPVEVKNYQKDNRDALFVLIAATTYLYFSASIFKSSN